MGGAVTISTRGIQEWTVPTGGIYRIEASGAQGGNTDGAGGLGAKIIGEFQLEKDSVCMILVGQQGSNLQI